MLGATPAVVVDGGIAGVGVAFAWALVVGVAVDVAIAEVAAGAAFDGATVQPTIGVVGGAVVGDAGATVQPTRDVAGGAGVAFGTDLTLNVVGTTVAEGDVAGGNVVAVAAVDVGAVVRVGVVLAVGPPATIGVDIGFTLSVVGATREGGAVVGILRTGVVVVDGAAVGGTVHPTTEAVGGAILVNETEFAAIVVGATVAAVIDRALVGIFVAPAVDGVAAGGTVQPTSGAVVSAEPTGAFVGAALVAGDEGVGAAVAGGAVVRANEAVGAEATALVGMVVVGVGVPAGAAVVSGAAVHPTIDVVPGAVLHGAIEFTDGAGAEVAALAGRALLVVTVVDGAVVGAGGTVHPRTADVGRKVAGPAVDFTLLVAMSFAGRAAVVSAKVVTGRRRLLVAVAGTVAGPAVHPTTAADVVVVCGAPAAAAGRCAQATRTKARRVTIFVIISQYRMTRHGPMAGCYLEYCSRRQRNMSRMPVSTDNREPICYHGAIGE